MKKTNANRKQIILVLWCLIFYGGCANELEKEYFGYEELVVVDGQLTDEAKVQVINLSYTTPVSSDYNENRPLSGAELWVEDNSGQTIRFKEQKAGVYASENNFAGTVGHSYKLVFITASGKRYESAEEPMIKPTGIQKITQRFAKLPSQSLGTNVAGLQFFIDTEDIPSDPSFFRYEWDETHRISVPYPAMFYWANDSIEHKRSPLPDTCYNQVISHSLILSNSAGLSGNQLLDVPIRFISADSLNFTNRYSIEVTQYSLSESTHSYYDKIKKFNESNGSLFDQQQGAVASNVSSLEDEKEMVLGYFEVAAVTKLRQFWNIEELDNDLLPHITGFSTFCEPSAIIQATSDSIAYYSTYGIGSTEKSYQLHDWEPDPFPFGTSYLRFAYCVNCTRFGKLAKPPYWVD